MVRSIVDFTTDVAHRETHWHDIRSGYTIFDQNTTVPAHAHEDAYEVLYVQTGQGRISIDGQMYRVEEGDVVVYLPGRVHSEDWRDTQNVPMVFFLILPADPCDGVLDTTAFARQPVFSSVPYRTQMSRIFWAMDTEIRSLQPGHARICECLADSLITLIQRLAGALGSGESALKSVPLAIQAQRYLDTHFNERITLQALADHLHVSVYHLSHEFTARIGRSPIAYLNRRRIDQAKLMLKSTSYPVYEIADRVGFENMPNFNHLFKRSTGMTPTQYRENHTKEALHITGTAGKPE